MPASTAFDDEFASPRQWVEMYRANGLQAVPAVSPREDQNYKRPALPWREFEDALIPEETVERWYAHGGPHRERSNMGLITGQCSGGVFCVDLDVKDGSLADAWWLGLIETHNSGIEPETPRQVTGGGGRQILFRAPAGWVPPTFKTPIGIDIRGQGGFMVAPPSLHASGRRYAWEAGCAPYEIEIELAPDWLIEAIDRLREEHGGGPSGARRERVESDAAKNAFGLDIDDREQKLRDMVWAAVVDMYRDCPMPPTQGEQDAVKARLWSHYLSTTKSRLNRPGADNADLLEAEGRGWSELERKWRYAIKKWDKEVCAAAAVERREVTPAPVAMREVIDPVTGEVTEEPIEDAPASIITATPYQWIPAAQIPPRDILYGRHFIRKFLSATVSPGGLGKSSLVMVEALAMVTGRPLLGDEPKRPMTVWYWNGEDPMEELQRRIAAACLHYRIEPADLGGRLFIDSGRTTEIIVAREDGGKLTIATPSVDAIIEQVKRHKIDALIIDPFVASHAVSENDNTKIEAVVKQWNRVADEGGCSVELVHHVRKPAVNGQETTVDDARGAGALLAKARSARVLNAMTAAEASEIGIEPKDRWAFFRVDNGKANLMPRGGEARWRRMVGVPLGNRIDAQEDNVGVATEWAKPGVLDGVSGQHVIAAQQAIAQGEWRLDPQCSNWVGLPISTVLGRDVSNKSDKIVIKNIITLWLQSGALEVVERPDAQRRMRPFVVVGSNQ